MAYVSTDLNLRDDAIGGSLSRWVYRTTDPIATFTAAGYISDAVKKGVVKGDIVDVVNVVTPVLYVCQVSSVTAGAATLQVNSGTLASLLVGLPTSLPATAGLPWLNGGVLQVS